MPEIRDRFTFEPDKDALSKWLGTRKAGFYAGNTAIHGFFEDFKPNSDITWFFFAIIGELVGAALTLQGGIRKGGAFLYGSIFLVLMFIICDILFAIKLHRNVAKKCYIDNLLFLNGEDDPIRSVNLKQRREEGKTGDVFYVSCIIFIAIVKIASVVLLGLFNNLMAYIPIAILYFFVCYVHIYHTGYAWAFWDTDRTFQKQYKEFARSGKHLAQTLEHTFSSDFELKLPISLGEIISITEDKPFQIQEDGQTMYKYILKTKGILTDNDISLIMNGQGDNQRRIIAYEARKHQLRNQSKNLLN